jgi:hypothetical protein
MTMVSGAAKAVPGAFLLKENALLRRKKKLCFGKGWKSDTAARRGK